MALSSSVELPKHLGGSLVIDERVAPDVVGEDVPSFVLQSLQLDSLSSHGSTCF